MILLSEKTQSDKNIPAFFQSEFPPDLILMMVWLAAGIVAIYLPIMSESPVRYVFWIPVVIFIPGYCLLSALFPKNDDIGFTERIALSFGFSIAITALNSLGLYFTSGEIHLDSIVITLFLFTVVMIITAFFRRAFLSSQQRFRVPFSRIRETIHKSIFPADSDRIDQSLSIILILVIIIAITTTIYVIASPKESEHFSEFFILGEKQMADDYPDQIITGLDYPMFVGVGNHEYRNVTYTIETWFLRTEFDTVMNTSRILSMDPGERLSLLLAHNETRIIPYNLSVRKTGYDRVEFLLFNETVPGLEVTGSDRINASYRDLYLRITVV